MEFFPSVLSIHQEKVFGALMCGPLSSADGHMIINDGVSPVEEAELGAAADSVTVPGDEVLFGDRILPDGTCHV